MHLRLLNKTLAGTAVSLSVPCYQFLMIFCATSAGGILFGEFAHLSTSEAQAYTVGVLAATAGLAVLSRNSAAEAAHAAEELGELQTLSEGTQSCEGDMSSYDDEVAPPSPQVARCTSMRRNSITVGGLGGVGIGAAIEEAQAALDEPQSRRMRGRAMSWSGGPFPPTLPDTPSTSLSGTPSRLARASTLQQTRGGGVVKPIGARHFRLDITQTGLFTRCRSRTEFITEHSEQLFKEISIRMPS